MQTETILRRRIRGLPSARTRTGFTLVELLVVMMIIAMLTSMISFAMFRSMQAAREAKTQALISKLHNVVSRQWDTYVTRQVAEGTPEDQLAAIRELIQWEMPDAAGDLVDAPASLINQNITGTVNGASGYIDAQCLYQLVLQIADDDLDRINFFSDDEVKDLDGNGSPDVFIDGWGEPIGFIRRPTGFPATLSDLNDSDSPDPFDLTDSPANGVYFPLIFSGGPDKAGGLTASSGTPNAGNAHLDNIHNHRIDARLR
ncbi:MAG: type II secretion system protein [Pirellulales bacterium]|nr:type II secretion system protein [Pirellulales bacterium]